MEALVLDKGGASEISAVEFSIIRRCATLTIELEALEKKFAEAGQATAHDLDLYGRTSGNLRRLFETLGIDRRARVVRPLNEIITEIDGERAATEGAAA